MCHRCPVLPVTSRKYTATKLPRRCDHKKVDDQVSVILISGYVQLLLRRSTTCITLKSLPTQRENNCWCFNIKIVIKEDFSWIKDSWKTLDFTTSVIIFPKSNEVLYYIVKVG